MARAWQCNCGYAWVGKQHEHQPVCWVCARTMCRADLAGVIPMTARQGESNRLIAALRLAREIEAQKGDAVK